MRTIKLALASLIRTEGATHRLIPHIEDRGEGLWYPDQRSIHYVVGRSEAWMVRIVLHEVIHMLLGHYAPCIGRATAGGEELKIFNCGMAKLEHQAESIAIRVWRSWGYQPLSGWYAASYWWRAPKYGVPHTPYRNRPIERRLIELHPTA